MSSCLSLSPLFLLKLQSPFFPQMNYNMESPSTEHQGNPVLWIWLRYRQSPCSDSLSHHIFCPPWPWPVPIPQGHPQEHPQHMAWFPSLLACSLSAQLQLQATVFSTLAQSGSSPWNALLLLVTQWSLNLWEGAQMLPPRRVPHNSLERVGHPLGPWLSLPKSIIPFTTSFCKSLSASVSSFSWLPERVYLIVPSCQHSACPLKVVKDLHWLNGEE